jgi:hypothetical protein
MIALNNYCEGRNHEKNHQFNINFNDHHGSYGMLQDAPGELDGEEDNDKTVVDIRSGADLTNIDTESSFVFEFTKDIDTSTVTESTFFMTESSSSASISKYLKLIRKRL